MSDDWETDADRAEEAELCRLAEEERTEDLEQRLEEAMRLLVEALVVRVVRDLVSDEWIAKARALVEPEGTGEGTKPKGTAGT